MIKIRDTTAEWLYTAAETTDQWGYTVMTRWSLPRNVALAVADILYTAADATAGAVSPPAP